MIQTNLIGVLPEDLDEAKTVTSVGKPVAERISSIKAARALFSQTRSGIDTDELRRARIKGQIDGNPPYDSRRLRELGMGYMTNVNFMEMRAILDLKASAHYELFFEVPSLVSARQVKFLTPNRDDELAMGYGEIVAEEFSKMLMDWRGFFVNMDKARREADSYGLGVMLFRDEWDWRPKAYSSGNFTPDPLADLDLDNLSYFFLDDMFPVGELIRWLSDESLAKSEGWNVAFARRLLVRIFQDGESQTNDKFGVSTTEDIQQKIRNNDWSVQSKAFQPVYVRHLLVQEVDTGEVSHYILPREETDNDDFLFKKTRRFKKMSHVLWWLPYNYGDGYLRSVRGLASLVEQHCDLSNRFLGRIFDAGFVTSSLVLQPKSAVDLARLQLVRMGVITVIPPELNTVQTSFQPQITPLVQLRELSSAIMKNNTGVFRQNPETFAERQPEKTAYQISQEVAKEARVEKASVAFDYEQMERLYREIFRRVTRREYITAEANYPGKDEAVAFIGRCVARLVPVDLLLTPGTFEVSVVRAIGLGSLGMKLDISQQVLNARGLYDDDGRNSAVRDWLAVRVGYQNVDRYLPKETRDVIMSNEDSIASLENNDFAEGTTSIVGSDQRHKRHFQRHSELVLSIIQLVVETGGQGADLTKIFNTLGAAIPHMEKHLQYLSLDPSQAEFVAAGIKLLKGALSVYEYIKKTMVKQQALVKAAVQDQQARLDEANSAAAGKGSGGMSEDAMIKMREIEMKQSGMQHIRVAKTQEQIELNRQKAAEDIRLQAERQAAELAMKAKTTDAKIELERAKAQETAGAE